METKDTSPHSSVSEPSNTQEHTENIAEAVSASKKHADADSEYKADDAEAADYNNQGEAGTHSSSDSYSRAKSGKEGYRPSKEQVNEDNIKNGYSNYYYYYIHADNLHNSNFGANGTVHNHSGNNKEGTQINGEEITLEKDIDRFIQANAYKKALAVLISLVSLEKIIEAYVWPLTELLKLTEHVSKSDRQRRQQESFSSIAQICYLIGAEVNSGELESPLGKMPVRFLFFPDNGKPDSLRRHIWANFPQFRKPILRWLMEIRENSEFDDHTKYRVKQALAAYAAIDIEFAYSTIIPELKNKKDIYGLCSVLGALINDDVFENNVDALIVSWIADKSDNFSWKAVFASLEDDRFKKHEVELQRRLQQIINQILMEEQPFLDNVTIYSILLFIMLTAHASTAARNVLVGALKLFFEQRKTYAEKFKAAEFIIALFHYDSLLTTNHYCSLALLECLFEDNNKSTLKDIYRFIWQHVALRKELSMVLFDHLKEAEKYERLAPDYLHPFVKMIAFTGKKLDYDNTMDFLTGRHFIKEPSKHAASSVICLKEILTARQTAI